MNQMGPPMQQGHFMGMNPMHSGPGGAPPSGIPNMQGPSSASGNQMFPSGGAFNRPQGAQMPPMPGLGPYQVRDSLYENCSLYVIPSLLCGLTLAVISEHNRHDILTSSVVCRSFFGCETEVLMINSQCTCCLF